MAERIHKGLAYGPHMSFWGASTANVFDSTDTTPDVTNGNLFFTNNASATGITHFDLRATNTGGTWSNQFEGKYIRVIVLDANTTFVPGNQLLLSESDATVTPYSSKDFIYHNSAWIEVGKNRPQTSGGVLRMNAAGTSSITSVTNYHTVFVTGTNACAVIKSISGGYDFQTIKVVGVGTSGITVRPATGGNIIIVGTDTFVFNASGVYEFTKRGAVWHIFNVR